MAPKHRLPGSAGVATSARVRDQPSLTTSSGRIWLLLGGLLAAISLGILVPMLRLAPAGVALTGIILIVVLYVGMLASLRVPPGKLRLTLMAWAMIAIAVVALASVFLVAAQQWQDVA